MKKNGSLILTTDMVPQYARDMMARSEWELDRSDYCPGYTVRIHKATAQTMADTLREEVERLCRWAERHYAETAILACPNRTHYFDQYAVVTITDPAMRLLERFMPETLANRH